MQEDEIKYVYVTIIIIIIITLYCIGGVLTADPIAVGWVLRAGEGGVKVGRLGVVGVVGVVVVVVVVVEDWCTSLPSVLLKYLTSCTAREKNIYMIK